MSANIEARKIGYSGAVETMQIVSRSHVEGSGRFALDQIKICLDSMGIKG